MSIPTEPIGSIPRSPALQAGMQAAAEGRLDPAALDGVNRTASQSPFCGPLGGGRFNGKPPKTVSVSSDEVKYAGLVELPFTTNEPARS